MVDEDRVAEEIEDGNDGKEYASDAAASTQINETYLDWIRHWECVQNDRR
jgi:hypothetical protein